MNSESGQCTSNDGANSDTTLPLTGATDAPQLSLPTNLSTTSKTTNLCDEVVVDCNSTDSTIPEVIGICDVVPLPKINAPEKIIICIDLSSELEEVPFRLGDGSQYTPLTVVKRTVNIFVQSKNIMNPRHEFAIVILRETAFWEVDFTSDVGTLTSFINNLDETSICESFDVSSLFQTIATKVTLPSADQSELTAPPFVIRTVLIYGRSLCVPKYLSGTEFQESLMKCRYFFLDVVYIHLPPSDTNSSETVFNMLCDLNRRGTSYILEVTRNTTRLHDYMAKLLAHPLQRPPQGPVDRIVSISPGPLE